MALRPRVQAPSMVLRIVRALCTALLGMLLSAIPAASSADGLDAKIGLFMRKGDASFSEAKYNEAVAWYEQVTENDSRHAQAFTMLAAAHYMAGGIAAAMRNFDKALEIEPKSLNALVRSGQLHLQVCNLERSRKDFAAALAIEPKHAEAVKASQDLQSIQQHLEKAKALAGSGQWEALAAALEPVLKLAADCMDAQLLLARQSLQQGDFEGCTMATGRVLKIQPSSTDALLLRASAFFKLEDFDTAKRHVGMVLTQYDPESSAAKKDFRSIKDYQKKVAALRSVVNKRNWTDIQLQLEAKMPELDSSHRILRAELNGALAIALLHLARPPDQVIAAADAALEQQYSEELVIIKSDALVKHERWEAAVQLLKQAMQQHGRSNKLQKALQDAQAALRRSKIKDYYKVLGVERDVDDKTLKRVYRKLALQYHPDKVDKAGIDAETAEKKFAEITEAYEVLSDAEKREMHDQGRDPNDPNAGFGDGGGFGGGGFHFGGQRFNVRFG